MHGKGLDTIYVAHSETESSQTKQGIGSTLAALIVASGGGSVGQYGPLVHLGSTIALTFRERFKIGSDTLIGCGVAAAISAGFGAPIAGVLFSHEAILRHFFHKGHCAYLYIFIYRKRIWHFGFWSGRRIISSFERTDTTE